MWTGDRHSLYEVVGDSKGSAKKHVRLQFWCLASILNWQFGCLINLSVFLEMRAGPSQVGWMQSLLIRPGFPQEVCQLSKKPALFVGHHLDSHWLYYDTWLNMLSLVRLGRGPEKITKSNSVLAKLTGSIGNS